MNESIISFTEGRDKLYRSACHYATAFGLGKEAQPLRLSFASDNIYRDSCGCVASLFETDAGVILRREWLKDHEVRYNRLINFDEIMVNAPNSVRHMQDNAIKVFWKFCPAFTRALG